MSFWMNGCHTFCRTVVLSSSRARSPKTSKCPETLNQGHEMSRDIDPGTRNAQTYWPRDTKCPEILTQGHEMSRHTDPGTRNVQRYWPRDTKCPEILTQGHRVTSKTTWLLWNTTARTSNPKYTFWKILMQFIYRCIFSSDVKPYKNISEYSSCPFQSHVTWILETTEIRDTNIKKILSRNKKKSAVTRGTKKKRNFAALSPPPFYSVRVPRN
jgi:hypothetical protein